MASICSLPKEILLYIFRIYLETENQHELFRTVYNVCSYWRYLCMDSSLFTKFDGTLPFHKMMQLCRNGSLINTTEIKFGHTELINIEEDMTELFSRSSCIKAIDFSNVKITKNILKVVACSCPHVSEIRFSTPEYTKNARKITYEVLGCLLNTRGESLNAIHLSHCSIVNVTAVLKCIADCCSNLEELHLINIICNSNAIFPTKYVQIRCPKLKVLHLDQNVNLGAIKHSEGFPNLEVFTYPDATGGAISDKEFGCIVYNSPKLKFMDLTNCNISAEIMCSLPACSVEYLFIPKSKICHSSNLCDVFKKWSHSLKQVDISGASLHSINKAVLDLISTPQSKLKYLQLNFTQITANAIQKVLENCHLDVLSLEGCRNLGRGMKRVYYGKSELKILSDKLIANMSDEEMSCD